MINFASVVPIAAFLEVVTSNTVLFNRVVNNQMQNGFCLLSKQSNESGAFSR